MALLKTPIVPLFLKIRNNSSPMFSSRTISIARIELTKYRNVFNIIIILFVYIQSILFSWSALKEIAEPVNTGISFFQVINYNFAALIFSAFPLTIILTISREFSTGYTMKLISNGATRSFYFKSKYLLASILMVLSSFLYVLAIPVLLSLSHVRFIDKIFLLKSISYTMFLSLFISIIVVSITFLVRNWQYSLLIYYSYSFAETFILYQFEGKAPWITYLPFHLATSIFKFRKNITTLNDYLLAGTILIFFCSIIIAASYHSFKKANL
jgi:hypothetical protein